MNNNIKYYLEHGFGFTPKAVLFDMDGVIYDSMPNHAIAWVESMRQFGLKMTKEEAYQYEGMRGVETIKHLASAQLGRTVNDAECEEIYEVKCNVFSSCPPARKMPGIEDLMNKIKTCGMKIVVVTGSGQRSLLDKMEEAFPGLIHRELMVTSFDVKQGKPKPDPYLMGLQKAGVHANEAVVVENAPLGVRAAKAAGIFTIAVNTGPLPDEILAKEHADIIFPTMQQLSDSWEKLIMIRQ